MRALSRCGHDSYKRCRAKRERRRLSARESPTAMPLPLLFREKSAKPVACILGFLIIDGRRCAFCERRSRLMRASSSPTAAKRLPATRASIEADEAGRLYRRPTPEAPTRAYRHTHWFPSRFSTTPRRRGRCAVSAAHCYFAPR